MKLEMTERDKKLLIGLAVGVIIVCFGYWGIFPILMDMQDIDDDIMTQSDLQQLNSMKIAQLPGLEMDNEAYEKEILEARSDFYKMMTSDRIDKEFTERILNHNLQAYDMTITMSEETANTGPYQYSRKALYGDEEEEDLEEEEVVVDSSSDLLFFDEEDDDITGIYAASVSLRLGGNPDDLQDFLEELVDEGIKIRLCSFMHDMNRNVSVGPDNAYGVVENNEMTVEFEIYMCEE